MVINRIIINLQPNLYNMVKVEKNTPTINPFGGINFVVDQINQAGISELIDSHIGKRPAQAEYSYSDLFKNIWSVFLCGGDCAEDLGKHLKPFLCQSPHVKLADDRYCFAGIEIAENRKGNCYFSYRKPL